MSNELIKAIDWLSWQLGMMYTVDEHSSRCIEVYGSESHCTIEYRWYGFVQVVISYDEDDEEKREDKVEKWEIEEDEEDEDFLMREMESILNYVRNNM